VTNTTIKSWATKCKYRAVRSIDRLRGASKTRFSLDVANLAASVWVVYVPSRVAYVRALGGHYSLSLPAYMGASVFLLLHKYLLRDLPGTKRWVRQDEMRKKEIQVAINKMTECVYREEFTALALFQTENYILHVIHSHVASTLRDTVDYLNVSLLVEDPKDKNKIMVLNRAKIDREIGVSYDKAKMLAWNAILNPDSLQYYPRVEIPGKEYKCILFVPVADLGISVTGSNVALGVVSIDSGKRDHIGPYTKELQISLLPHIANLRAILLLRRKHNVWA
jgi:hypothetical protein